VCFSLFSLLFQYSSFVLSGVISLLSIVPDIASADVALFYVPKCSSVPCSVLLGELVLVVSSHFSIVLLYLSINATSFLVLSGERFLIFCSFSSFVLIYYG
jgi:hypothetical protein